MACSNNNMLSEYECTQSSGMHDGGYFATWLDGDIVYCIEHLRDFLMRSLFVKYPHKKGVS